MSKIQRLIIAEFIHESAPQTLTPEHLAEWVQKNKKESIQHNDEIPLTEEQIKEHEHKLSNASREALKLDNLNKYFSALIKKGNGEKLVSVEIQPTKGLEVLKANIAHHDRVLQQGYEVETTWVFLVPWPEKSKMVGLTVEGKEVPKYTRAMTEDEKRNFGQMFAKDDNAAEAKRRKKKIGDFTVEGGSGAEENPVRLVKDEEPAPSSNSFI